MPIGSFQCVSHIAHRIAARQPKSILDIGIGDGFYGAVVRRYRDSGVCPWFTRLVGIEPFEPYRNPCWSLYDDVWVETVQTSLATRRDRFDMVIWGDCIEHLEMNDADEVVNRLVKDWLNPGGSLLVSTPAIWCPQDEVHGNVHEIHKTLFSRSYFELKGFSLIKDGAIDEYGHMMLLGEYVKEAE